VGYEMGIFAARLMASGRLLPAAGTAAAAGRIRVPSRATS
jgi:hypothetical protein